jgi:hypothetical protein
LQVKPAIGRIALRRGDSSTTRNYRIRYLDAVCLMGWLLAIRTNPEPSTGFTYVVRTDIVGKCSPEDIDAAGVVSTSTPSC